MECHVTSIKIPLLLHLHLRCIRITRRLEPDGVDEAIPPLLANRGDGGRVDILVGLEVFEQLANTQGGRLVVRGVGNTAVANHVVHNLI